MFRIGLTGGIGSGKSTAQSLFQVRGVAVFDADAIAHHLCAPETEAWHEIVTAFGQDCLLPSGELNRPFLRQRVFSDRQAKTTLEHILHPRVYTHLAERSAAADSPYVIWGVPLLFESGGEHHVDRVLVVDCPPSLQRARVLQRGGGWTPQQVDAVIAQQWPREKRIAAADDILENSQSLEMLNLNVASLHTRYRDLSRAYSPTAVKADV